MGSLLLAWREIRRSKGRFGLLTGAVAVLVFLIVFQQALLDGLVTQFVGAIRNQSADVLVYGADARLNLQGSVVPPAVVDAARKVRGVARAEPLGVATVTVTAASQLQDATVFGHVLGGPGEPRVVAAGRRPQRDGEAVASKGSADGFSIGERVVVEPSGLEIVVVGSAQDSSFSVTPTLFTSYATYEQIRLAANPDAPRAVPSAVAVALDPDAGADEVVAAIDREIDGVEAATRDRAAAEAPGVEAVGQSFGVILLLTYIVATVVIGFFFLILTVQKTATLTLLRAIGAPARRLLGSFAVQVAVVVGGGLALGTLLAAAALRFSGSGIDARIEPRSLATTVLVVVVLAAAACAASTRRITRLDPAAATLPSTGAR